jgi:glutamate synthase domain-containing protein 3
MKRINVTFYDETYEALEARMKINGEKSLAPGVRELVNLGLKIEEAAQENNENRRENELEKILLLLKNHLTWLLETRLLARYLVEHFPESSKEKQAEILEKYKESAIHFVKGMFGESVS